MSEKGATTRGERRDEQHQYDCTACDASFDSYDALAAHTDNVHSAYAGSKGIESEKIQKEMAQK
ncbi:MAG TPA: C2H2-type zinc finger protein [Nitrososphaera sp.]|nr:C2H2-type zinc finger protein [Nitrososphaera sp.]